MRAGRSVQHRCCRSTAAVLSVLPPVEEAGIAASTANCCCVDERLRWGGLWPVSVPALMKHWLGYIICGPTQGVSRTFHCGGGLARG